uniref:Ig-like domain-containing protein n=2 Tax=Sus scrofa TaxID=9823 RepID=A0A8D1KD04_PIG
MPEAGSFVKTASLPNSHYNTHQQKKSKSPVISPQPQSNLGSSPWVIRFLFVRNLPERSLLPLHCHTMILVFTLMLEVFLFLRGTGAQSVTQSDSLITVPEGDPLELRCNYSSSFSTYHFWYVQYPNQGLQLLLKYVSGNSLVKGTKGFEAEFRKNETSFHLRKTSVHLSDSAKYFCALSDTVTETAGGAEHKPLRHSSLKDPASQPVLFSGS